MSILLSYSTTNRWLTLYIENPLQFETMAAAHEGWIGELLGGVSEEDTKRLAAMLKSFRSNWEGRE